MASDAQHSTPILPLWSIAAPVVSWLLLGAASMGWGGWFEFVVAGGLCASVLAAVHHAEVVAHRVGEPYGTLVLAVAITVIEVALIVSLMLAGGPETAALPRDTVFAAVMIILNGMVGLCLLVGGHRHKEQVFGLLGVSAALATLAAISVLTMVLPNYTSSVPGPVYSTSQLVFIAIVSLVLYGTFVLVQTVRHRDYFLPSDHTNDGRCMRAAVAQGHAGQCAAAVRLPGRGGAAGQIAGTDHRKRRCVDRRAQGAGRYHHCHGRAVAGEPGGAARGPCQPADQHESGAGFGAGQYRPDHPDRGDRLGRDRLDADARDRREVDSPADAVADGGNLVAGHGAYHGPARHGILCCLPFICLRRSCRKRVAQPANGWHDACTGLHALPAAWLE